MNETNEIGTAALRVALREMRSGAKEIGGNNSGPFVAKYLSPAGIAPPQPWCAAFVSWCIRAAAAELRASPPLPYLIRARSFFRLGRRKGWITSDPQAGDIVVWRRGNPMGPLGHVGIVLRRSGAAIETLEGNRSPRVARFRYTLGRMSQLLGFVRLP